MMLQINEMDQTIVGPCDLDTYVAPNEFIRDLIADAVKAGKATRHDADGCPVTAIVTA